LEGVRLEKISPANCRINDDNWVIRRTLAVLGTAGSVVAPEVGNTIDNIGNRFVKYDYTINAESNVQTHYTLVDRQKNIFWNPNLFVTATELNLPINKRLIKQNNLGLNANIRGYGCYMRSLQAIAEILAGQTLTIAQIEELYRDGMATSLEEYNTNNAKYIITGFHSRINSNVVCYVEDANRVIAKAMEKLGVTNITAPIHLARGTNINDPTYINNQFVIRRHKTRYAYGEGDHFTLTYRNRETEIFEWDSWDYSINKEEFVRNRNDQFRFFG